MTLLGAFRRIAPYVITNRLRILFFRIGGISVGSGCRIARGVRIGKHATIGNYAQISGNAVIGSDTCLGQNVRVRANTKVVNSHVDGNVFIGESSIVQCADIGSNSMIEYGVVMLGVNRGRRIRIGDNSYIGVNNILDFSDDIVIGDYVHIAGASTGLWTHSSINTAISGKAVNDQKSKSYGSIKIQNYCWIGGNCTIYPGVTVKEYSVILPNSVVNADVEGNIMVGGVPARKIKDINLNVNP